MFVRCTRRIQYTTLFRDLSSHFIYFPCIAHGARLQLKRAWETTILYIYIHKNDVNVEKLNCTFALHHNYVGVLNVFDFFLSYFTKLLTSSSGWNTMEYENTHVVSRTIYGKFIDDRFKSIQYGLIDVRGNWGGGKGFEDDEL